MRLASTVALMLGFAGVALVWALLVTEHVVLARRGKAGLEMAFFTINGIVSCVLGVAGVLFVAAGAGRIYAERQRGRRP